MKYFSSYSTNGNDFTVPVKKAEIDKSTPSSLIILSGRIFKPTDRLTL